MKAKKVISSLAAIWLAIDLPGGRQALAASPGMEEELLFADLPMVVTASRKAEPLDMAPNVMYLVTKEMIKERGLRSVGDLLKTIPGFFAVHNPNNQQYYPYVRGVVLGHNNGDVTVMLNGHRVNNVNESSDLAWPVTLDMAERVEVIVGPGSVLHGTDSLLATINIITQKTEGTEVTVSAGATEMVETWNRRRSYRRNNDLPYSRTVSFNGSGTVMVGQTIDDTKHVSASATLAFDEGYTTYQAGRKFRGETLGGVVQPSHFLTGTARLDHWTFQYTSLNQRLGQRNTAPNRYNMVDTFRLQNTHQITDRVTATAEVYADNKRLYRQGAGFDWYQRLYGGEYSFQRQEDSSFLQAGVQGSYSSNRHNLNVPDLRYRSGQAGQTTNTLNLITLKDSNVVGVFASQEKSFVEDRVTLVGAIRGDRHSIVNPKKVYPSPRVAVIIRPADTWILKVMYNTATKFPEPMFTTLRLLDNADIGTASASPAGTITPGPAKRPERLATTELQTIHYFGPLRLSANIYYQALKNFIQFSQNARWTNIGNFYGRGIEGGIGFKSYRTEAWLNAGWQEARFDKRASINISANPYETPDGRMAGAPRYVATAGMTRKMGEGGKISLTPLVRYFDDQPLQRTWFDVPTAQLPAKAKGSQAFWDVAKHQTYVDLTYLHRDIFRKGLDLRLTGKNLLDNRELVARMPERGDAAPEGLRVEIAAYFKF